MPVLTSAELTVIAALGASALTGGASLGVVALRERLRRKAADQDTLVSAVTEMLSRSMSVTMRAQAMGETMKQRSGISEGVDVTLRYRKPADLLELHDWVAQDMAPLHAAWSVIWARGDQELVRLANQLLASCGDVVAAATARMPAGNTTARMRRHVIGERWTPEMQEALQQAAKTLAYAREQLAQYARTILRLAPAQLFGHEPLADGGATLATPGEAAPLARSPAPPPALDGKTPGQDGSI